MTTETATLNEQLGELLEKERAARRRPDDVQRERSAAHRALAGARADEADYHEAVAAGERDADPDVERELRERVRRAEDGAADEIWAGRLTGARRAAESALAELETFRSEHRAGLIAEHVEWAFAHAARCVAVERERARLWAEWGSEGSYLVNAIGVDAEDVHKPPVAVDGQAYADFESLLRECPNIAPTLKSLTAERE